MEMCQARTVMVSGSRGRNDAAGESRTGALWGRAAGDVGGVASAAGGAKEQGPEGHGRGENSHPMALLIAAKVWVESSAENEGQVCVWALK